MDDQTVERVSSDSATGIDRWKSFAQETTSMVKLLRGDLDRAVRGYQAAQEYDDTAELDYQKRQVVRSLFAMIEGIVHFHRQTLLLARSSVAGRDNLTTGELAILRGSEFFLTDRGKPKERPIKTRLPDLFCFVMRVWCREMQIRGWEPKFHGPEWDAFTRALKVRDRLMHPKSVSDLVVRDEEIDDMVTTEAWLIDMLDEMGNRMFSAHPTS